MSGLAFLTSSDFMKKMNNGRTMLCHAIKGMSMILFYSTQCTHCQSMIPKYKKLPGAIHGCIFGMINVSQNKDIVSLSENTISPIQYVPLIILYIDGNPFMRYDGPPETQELINFIINIHSKLKNKQTFVSEDIEEETNEIPCYGIPCGNNKTYLKFIEAYPPTN
jgi:thiol-disulfide isomerase/thioredoxin